MTGAVQDPGFGDAQPVGVAVHGPGVRATGDVAGDDHRVKASRTVNAILGVALIVTGRSRPPVVMPQASERVLAKKIADGPVTDQ